MKEADVIHRLLAPLATSSGANGLTDDVARLDLTGKAHIITTDTLVEGVHFQPWDPPFTIAQKLVRVNVSDCLAKGALPVSATFNLAWPEARSENELQDLVAGFGEDLARFSISLIGGDTVSIFGPMVLTLTLIGECRDGGPVRRSGARAGDALYVSGTIGDAGLGLAFNQTAPSDVAGSFSDGDERSRARTRLVNAYRVPALPNMAIADLVARYASASMDISDGLIVDASKLADASKVKLTMDLEAMPVSPAARHVLGKPPTIEERQMLATSGDDYQVLMSVSNAWEADFLEEISGTDLQMTRIGFASVGSGFALTDATGAPLDMVKSGYEHSLGRSD